MNPLREMWRWAGEAIWSRRHKGSWKKRAIAAEATLNLMRSINTTEMSASFKYGWKTGWDEALKIAGIQFTGFDWPTPPEATNGEDD